MTATATLDPKGVTAMTLTESTDTLTQPWNEILTPEQTGDGYKVLDHDPRITMLREAIASSSGGTTSGRSAAATRNILNFAALDLWQKIDEQTRSALTENGIKPAKELIDALTQLGTSLDALRNTNSITEQAHERIKGRVDRWRSEIENLFDPATEKEIRSACPECRAEKVKTDTGERWAVIAYYWKGHSPAARCQACGHEWQGDKRLLELGFSINANMDHVELRALGVA